MKGPLIRHRPRKPAKHIDRGKEGNGSFELNAVE
jgi:hypothetical protein